MVKGAGGRCFIVHNSAGHGLNMQEGAAAHLVWFGITWDFELFDQFIRRIRRRGNQAQRIFMHLLIVRGTIDEMKLTALGEKNMTQESLFGALKRILADGGAGEQEKVMVAKLTPRGGPPQGAAQGTAGGGWGDQPPQTAQGQREAIQENIQPRESVRGAFSGGTQAALDQVQRGDYGETAPQGGNAWGQGQQSAQNGPQGGSSWGQGGQQATAQTSPLPDPQQTQTAVEAPKRTRSRKAAEPEANGGPDAAAIRLELLKLIVPTDPAMSAEDLLDVCADLAEWVLTGERPS